MIFWQIAERKCRTDRTGCNSSVPDIPQSRQSSASVEGSQSAEQIAPAVTLLFQTSLNQGKVPLLWKAAYIAQIFKKGSRSSAENYRPISLTSILSKMCEHIVHCAISNHFDTHNVLSDAQHGFRKRRSQLILTVDDLAKVFDDKSQMDTILLDFSKAFDKVPHKRLLLKVASHGITGPEKSR